MSRYQTVNQFARNFVKAGCINRDLFQALSEGVLQKGVTFPLLSNIMLREFGTWINRNYLDTP
ncbi:hypothetical protein [Glaciimonas immobilis]|uniref:Retron-type reverse transcriptase n=1 Tax=Glaciimonas immobilis TaxID=728004 RepID=A0A840RS35_9BURK|nr:hypothetical protein [Glaciimonas immobilis]KAF3998027.1 hypothetical protein HAV38_10735 [Glaciimonas immobilis]MBB5199289.1 retron-type reverse transcriptase [Glaciimonas immobilis]